MLGSKTPAQHPPIDHTATEHRNSSAELDPHTDVAGNRDIPAQAGGPILSGAVVVPRLVTIGRGPAHGQLDGVAANRRAKMCAQPQGSVGSVRTEHKWRWSGGSFRC